MALERVVVYAPVVLFHIAHKVTFFRRALLDGRVTLRDVQQRGAGLRQKGRVFSFQKRHRHHGLLQRALFLGRDAVLAEHVGYEITGRDRVLLLLHFCKAKVLGLAQQRLNGDALVRQIVKRHGVSQRLRRSGLVVSTLRLEVVSHSPLLSVLSRKIYFSVLNSVDIFVI